MEKGCSAFTVQPGLKDQLNAFEKQILTDASVRASESKKHAASILKIDARKPPYLLRKHHWNDGAISNLSHQ